MTERGFAITYGMAERGRAEPAISFAEHAGFAFVASPSREATKAKRKVVGLDKNRVGCAWLRLRSRAKNNRGVARLSWLCHA